MTVTATRDLLYQPVKEQARLIKTKELSPVELVRATLDRIEALDPKLNAFLTVAAEQALAQAKEAERQVVAGNYLGSLHGIPYGVKDNIMTKGILTTGGSVILKDYVPEEDASVIQRLNAAGAILVGKTHLSEFATGGWNPHYGTPRNPWDLERTPGGSSSGSGSAVAAGMASFSLGTDTGGSGRIPGSHNGIYGLKPTYGRVSRHGVYVLSFTLDCTTALTRTAEDMAIVMNAIAGADGLDPSCAQVPVVDHTKGINRNINELRIGVFPEHFYKGIAEEVVAAVEEVLNVLKSLGATVKTLNVPHVELTPAVYDSISPCEATTWHEGWVRTRPQDYVPRGRDRFEAGQLIPATQYIKALRARSILRDAWLEVMKEADIFVTPATPRPAAKLDEPRPSTAGYLGGEIYTTACFSVNGFPSMATPCGFSSEGLPLSVLVNGRPFEENLVLRTARAYERATQWTVRHPPL